MDPNNDFLNRSSLPYTPHGSLQHMYGPYELRSASASQIQQHRFSNPPYEFVTRAQQTAVQHGNNVSDEWSSVVDLPQPDVSQLTASSNFDPEQLQRFLRSENEGPWIAYGQQYGPSQQQLSQDWHPRLSVPKAHTIAGHPVTLPTQRSASGGRPSQTDYSADSGFESQVTCSNGQDDIPESLSPCRRRDGVESQHGPANSPLRKRPGSVKSESHAERRSRRKKTTVVPPCHVCGKELKNRSDARYAWVTPVSLSNVTDYLKASIHYSIPNRITAKSMDVRVQMVSPHRMTSKDTRSLSTISIHLWERRWATFVERVQSQV